MKGFTLIELLVVVLIIGILSAVALPQYRKIMIRLDVVQVKLILEQITKSQSVYKAANGEYAFDLENLDISFPNVIKEDNNSWQYDINLRRTGLTRIQLASGEIYFTNWVVGCDGFMSYEGAVRCGKFRDNSSLSAYADYACQIFENRR